MKRPQLEAKFLPEMNNGLTNNETCLLGLWLIVSFQIVVSSFQLQLRGSSRINWWKSHSYKFLRVEHWATILWCNSIPGGAALIEKKYAVRSALQLNGRRSRLIDNQIMQEERRGFCLKRRDERSGEECWLNGKGVWQKDVNHDGMLESATERR